MVTWLSHRLYTTLRPAQVPVTSPRWRSRRSWWETAELEVPRDRDGSFESKIVAKRQKRLTGVDEMVISLTAKRLTTGEITTHLAEVYGAQVSRQAGAAGGRRGGRGRGREQGPRRRR